MNTLEEVKKSFNDSGAAQLGINMMLNLEVSKSEIKKLDGFITYPHEWAKASERIIAHIRSYSDPTARVVYGRNTTVDKITLEELRSFCGQYHIQGANKLGIQGWGIFQDNELLGVLSLGRHHRQNSTDTILDRMCFKTGVRVIGGATKLFARAIDWCLDQNIPKIVSFSDNRWSKGTVYEKLGFELDEQMYADYFYVERDNYLKYYSKQSQKKSNCACPPGMTEKEWAELRGLIQVYDAGKKRWIYKIALKRTIKNSFNFRKNGYYKTKKAGTIYYSSSYELRAAYLLDQMPEIESYNMQVMFDGTTKKRYIDFLVRKNGERSIIEVKPERKIKDCQEQITDNKAYAAQKGWGFELWTEQELGFKNDYWLDKWANEFISEITGIDYIEERRLRGVNRSKKYYHSKVATSKIEVFCEFCNEVHSPLRKTYNKAIAEKGRYICEREGGHIAGSKPKKKKENPYAADEKKLCEGANSCGQIKPLNEFSTGKSICKTCRSKVYKKKYHEK